jgi:hypothetical protein
MMMRSERERRDYETGHWQLLDEIMEAIRCEHQAPDEVIEALLTALAKVVVQGDIDALGIARIKQSLECRLAGNCHTFLSEFPLAAVFADQGWLVYFESIDGI